MNKFTAVIPVRESTFGSLKDKDYLPFAGTNLLIHKIRQLKEIPNLNIVVSTDSEKLALMAQKENVTVMKRPSKYSLENNLFGDFVRYVCVNINSEHILWACVTSPLVSAVRYTEAIRIYEEKLQAGYDSLVSVQKLQRYLMDENGALNFRTGNCLKSVDQLPKLFIFTNGISIAPRESMIRWKYTSGDMPYMMVLDKRESIDICDEFDYECAKRFLDY